MRKGTSDEGKLGRGQVRKWVAVVIVVVVTFTLLSLGTQLMLSDYLKWLAGALILAGGFALSAQLLLAKPKNQRRR